MFKRERYNGFTEDINTTISIDSVETNAYVTRKDLICKKEKTKCNNVIKQYKKWLSPKLTLMILQKKT